MYPVPAQLNRLTNTTEELIKTQLQTPACLIVPAWHSPKPDKHG